MFYDFENHSWILCNQIYEVLDNNGIWILNKVICRSMLNMNAYDTICHEHLEYYSLKTSKIDD